MTETLFDIVFRGDIVPGHNIAQVKQRLAQLFKVDAGRIDALFSGGAVPLKRNLDKSTAEKYRATLHKAGAEVQVRPVGSAGAKPPAAPRAVPARPPLSLAPRGAYLLAPSERPAAQPLELDLSAYSLRPMEGDLLDAAERRPEADAPLDIPALDLAEPGADLLEGYRDEGLPLPDIDPDFELAEAGADLLEGSERREVVAPQLDLSHLSVLPPGGQ